MFCKAFTALIALLAFCLAPFILADTGSRVGVFVKRPVSTMSHDPIGAVNDVMQLISATSYAQEIDETSSAVLRRFELIGTFASRLDYRIPNLPLDSVSGP